MTDKAIDERTQRVRTYLQDTQILIEEEEKAAAQDAIMVVLEQQIEQVSALKKNNSLSNLEVLSGEIGTQDGIPRQVKRELGQLHERIQAIILSVASEIENRNYQALEQVAEDDSLDVAEKEQVTDLVEADKSFRISTQTLRLTVELFQKLNNRIKERLETLDEGEVDQERSLVVGNAVIVYEVTDFVIKYLEDFRPTGKEEIKRVHQAVSTELEDIRRESERLRLMAEDTKVSEGVRQNLLKQADSFINGINLVNESWEEYLESTRETEGRIQKTLEVLPTLHAMRQAAQVQLRLLSVMTITQMITDNLRDLSNTVSLVENITLVELDPDRVRRLLNLQSTK